ncbi:MAG: bifunctional tRNA (5-methylaminomethyl-2-thiouridine)(34)-methyltransferase MnmD/FAD-dependent 5-carboxymethylaminomethyl-2-thiouridine(34) oxidoreductase MnmC [Marinicella sp.]
MTQLNLEYLNPTDASFNNRQPFCDRFDDVYFNDTGGLKETEFVFIEHNNLVERWQQGDQLPAFCIAETGFGTGLNFLTTCHHWQQRNRKPKRLHFISFEKYPLSSDSLKLAYENFPELANLSQQLLTVWGNFRTGLQQHRFTDDITLTLVFGDANSYIHQINAQVDAWFLDGFAPQKNPDLWHDRLFNQMNRLSHSTTTLSTYTAASGVNKALSRNGFKVKKVTGFGKKREMITARFECKTFEPQKVHPWAPLPKQQFTESHVCIVGAGIAGMCLAQQFKQAGYTTTVIEQNLRPMRQASGNDMAMVMPLITAQDSPESLFYIRAFETALHFYHEHEFHPIGVTQNLKNNQPTDWIQKLQHAGLAKELLNRSEHDPNKVVYASAGYVDTQRVARRMSQFVDHWVTEKVSHISQLEDGKWQLFNDHEKIHETGLLLIAAGMQSQELLDQTDLSLTAKHGQTTSIKVPSLNVMNSIQLHKGYVIPAADQSHWLCGATFDHVPIEQQFSTAELAQDHWQRNLALWQHHPLHDSLKTAEVISGFAAIRATTPDHLPICGPIINQELFRADYHDLHHGRHWQTYPPASATDNLFILSGLGSRGFTAAPLLAKYLCAMILGEPLPLEADLCKIIHPNRFLYRRLKKRH